MSMPRSSTPDPARKTKENQSPQHNVPKLAVCQNKTNASFTVCSIYTSNLAFPRELKSTEASASAKCS